MVVKQAAINKKNKTNQSLTGNFKCKLYVKVKWDHRYKIAWRLLLISLPQTKKGYYVPVDKELSTYVLPNFYGNKCEESINISWDKLKQEYLRRGRQEDTVGRGG